MLWLTLSIAVSLGAFFGGWRSLRLAREGELQQAHRTLHSAALVAGVCGGLLTMPTLGWPFIAVSESVPEEVTKTVIETVEVPVRVTVWFFWTAIRMEPQAVPKSVSETIFHSETRQQFSFLLLALMAGVGMLCYYAEKMGCFSRMAICRVTTGRSFFAIKQVLDWAIRLIGKKGSSCCRTR